MENSIIDKYYKIKYSRIIDNIEEIEFVIAKNEDEAYNIVHSRYSNDSISVVYCQEVSVEEYREGKKDKRNKSEDYLKELTEQVDHKIKNFREQRMKRWNRSLFSFLIMDIVLLIILIFLSSKSRIAREFLYFLTHIFSK